MAVISCRQDVEANDDLKAASEKVMLDCIKSIEPERQTLTERNKTLAYGLVFEYQWNSDDYCFIPPTEPRVTVENNSSRVGTLKETRDAQARQLRLSQCLPYVSVYMRPVVEDTIHWIGLELVTKDGAKVKAEDVEYRPEDLDAEFLAAIFTKWDQNEYRVTLKYNNDLMVFKLRKLIFNKVYPNHHQRLEIADRERLVDDNFRPLLLCAKVLPKMIGFLEEAKASYRPMEDWSWQALC